MSWREIKQTAKMNCKGNILDYFIFNLLAGLLYGGIIGGISKVLLDFGIKAQKSPTDTTNTIIVLLLTLLMYVFIVSMVGTSFLIRYSIGLDIYDGYGVAISRVFWVITKLFAGFGIGWSIMWRMLIPIYGYIAMLKLPMVLVMKYKYPKMSAHRCWKEASYLMKGYKLKMFGFMLSMILWMLLCCTVIGAIWAIPWMMTATAGFCEIVSDGGEL